MKKPPQIHLFSALLISLLFLGAGCFQAADKTAETAVQGAVGTPLKTLDKAKKLTASETARQRREADSVSNTVHVALTVTEGKPVPDGVAAGAVFGCQDRTGIIEVSRAAATNQVVSDALTTLFALKETTFRGLYNALAFSDLKVDEVFLNDDGETEVHISGQTVTSGVCDDPRVIAQVEETIRYYHPEFKVVLNDSDSAWRCLTDQSGRCE